MAEFKALLSFMDASDREKVLRRYERGFDEACAENEAAHIKTLGSPVRQVLIVEKEYRERQEAGLPGVEDEPEAEAVEEAAEPVQEEAVPAEETETAADEIYPGTELDEFLRESFAREQEVPAGEAEGDKEPEPASGEDDEEEEPDDEEMPEEEEEASGSSGGRVFGAVMMTPLMIPLAIFGILLTAALAALALGPGLLCGAGCIYLLLYALSTMSYLPDIIFTLGLSLAALAFAILFLWLCIWLLVEGVSLCIRMISRIYGKVLWKGGTDNE